ncbi:hypothetical protein OD350_28705 (plasmid) [Clostridium beijerinckii]|uniref:MAC/perforin domain-containing protein n=1 Tax=Clostridium beijerinckii TaxID=1520 RepID=UPI002225F66B|nr:MAC/perforin domain-containing protein [Clostridium beijerinckii]UYZ39055.1 hypothetical protein OD350_28705 [Clostridium beijerinckii]
MEEIPYQNGMNLGLGYNILTNSGLVSSALDNVNLLRPVVQASGQKVQFSIEMLSNSLSLAEQIGVSASASLSYGTLGSGSAKISLVNSFKQNSFSVYVLVKVHVQNQQTLLDLTQIKMSDKSQLLYVTRQSDFINQYGSHFIYGLISGGEYYGILEIESKSSEEYREIKSELSGKALVGVMSASGSGTFEQTLNKLSSSYKLKATIIRDGAEGALQPISSEQLIKDAINFPASVLNEKAVPFSVLIFPYNQIVSLDVDEIKINERQYCLNKIAKIYERHMRRRNDLQYAIDNSELFPGLDSAKVEDYIIKINDYLDKLKASVNKVLSESDDLECSGIPIDNSLMDNILPNQTAPSPLGYRWLWQNGGWSGIWTRRPGTNTFDCYDQLNEDKGGPLRDNFVTYEVDIYISGEDVTIIRKKSSDHNNMALRGKLVDNGTKVKSEDDGLFGKWTAVIDRGGTLT